MQHESSKDIDSLLVFYKMVNPLKTTPRRGWLQAGVSMPETVAAHSLFVGFILPYLAEKIGNSVAIDVNKALRMALFHDVAESITGDFTPLDYLPKLEKQQKESAVIKQINALLPTLEIQQLWLEYVEQKTNEAKLAKDADILEGLLQLIIYKKQFPKIEWTGFKEYWRTKLNFDICKEIFNELAGKC